MAGLGVDGVEELKFAWPEFPRDPKCCRWALDGSIAVMLDSRISILKPNGHINSKTVQMYFAEIEKPEKPIKLHLSNIDPANTDPLQRFCMVSNGMNGSKFMGFDWSIPTICLEKCAHGQGSCLIVVLSTSGDVLIYAPPKEFISFVSSFGICLTLSPSQDSNRIIWIEICNVLSSLVKAYNALHFHCLAFSPFPITAPTSSLPSTTKDTLLLALGGSKTILVVSVSFSVSSPVVANVAEFSMRMFGGVRAIKWTKLGEHQLLLCGCNDGSLRAYVVTEGTLAFMTSIGSNDNMPVTSIACSPTLDMRLIVVVSKQNFLRCFIMTLEGSVSEVVQPAAESLHQSHIAQIVTLPNTSGFSVLSWSRDGRVVLTEVDNSQLTTSTSTLSLKSLLVTNDDVGCLGKRQFAGLVISPSQALIGMLVTEPSEFRRSSEGLSAKMLRSTHSRLFVTSLSSLTRHPPLAFPLLNLDLLWRSNVPHLLNSEQQLSSTSSVNEIRKEYIRLQQIFFLPSLSKSSRVTIQGTTADYLAVVDAIRFVGWLLGIKYAVSVVRSFMGKHQRGMLSLEEFRSLRCFNKVLRLECPTLLFHNESSVEDEVDNNDEDDLGGSDEDILPNKPSTVVSSVGLTSSEEACRVPLATQLETVLEEYQARYTQAHCPICLGDIDDFDLSEPWGILKCQNGHMLDCCSKSLLIINPMEMEKIQSLHFCTLCQRTTQKLHLRGEFDWLDSADAEWIQTSQGITSADILDPEATKFVCSICSIISSQTYPRYVEENSPCRSGDVEGEDQPSTSPISSFTVGNVDV